MHARVSVCICKSACVYLSYICIRIYKSLLMRSSAHTALNTHTHTYMA